MNVRGGVRSIESLITISMDYACITITKRDGSKENFSIEKIERAIAKAYRADGMNDDETSIKQVTAEVAAAIDRENISVEEIQDLVERKLMMRNPSVAKKFIIYREWRTKEREKRTSMKQVMDGIVAVEKNDVNLSNANMSSHTPAGQMMTFASEVTKDYAYKYLVGVRYGRAHREGDIHIHDLDYYPTKTTTCVQYDLEDIFNRGFHTKNGTVRTPQSIQSYATLATIVFQTNQNEQHGGQSIPAFDHFMAPGVLKSFRKHFENGIGFICRLHGMEDMPALKDWFRKEIVSIDMTEEQKAALGERLKEIGVSVSAAELDTAWRQSYEMTRKDTHQAMEGLVHNLNTMHSRGGNQAEMQNAIAMRHRIVKIARDYYDTNGFYEIETPILIKSTPEGARDYLVPSRVQQGKFYALPQSPQLYKQILMCSGFDRYMQIARCFRDEDLRADRQPEFTQIDVEMSFIDEEDIMTMNEGFMKRIFKEVLGKELDFCKISMTSLSTSAAVS